MRKAFGSRGTARQGNARHGLARRCSFVGMMCLQLLLPITADDSSSSTNVGNSGLVAKRKAQRAEKERFEESHAAAFDEYGRTLRYGTTVGDIKCELTAAMGQWRCSVVDFEARRSRSSPPPPPHNRGSTTLISIVAPRRLGTSRAGAQVLDQRGADTGKTDST